MYIPRDLEVQFTNKGEGLFTKFSIKNYTLVAKEKDFFISVRENVGKFSIQITKELFLDYKKHPHYLDFVNHSCEPNMKYNVSNFAFYAIKDIQKGEELTCDYETTESNLVLDRVDFECKCGSGECRGHISGYDCV